MKATHYIYTITLMILVLSCHAPTKKILTNDSKGLSFPPGTVQVDDNFYVDRNEIGNIDYREYLAWIIRVYGSDSEELIAAYPNESVWKFATKDLQQYETNYLNADLFSNYPVVGINRLQAEKYASWRTNIIAQSRLIQMGYIKAIKDQTKDNLFTITQYMKGEYPYTTKQISKIEFPIYTVPTLDEWNRYVLGITEKKTLNYVILTNNDGTIRKATKYYNISQESITNKIGPKSNAEFLPMNNGLWHTIGNVSEIITGQPLAMGGSWLNTLTELNQNLETQFTQENYYTGFRNVCRFQEFTSK